MTNTLKDQGVSGKIDGITLPIAMIIAGFFSIAIYNVLEINVLIFATFQRRVGLYFWSLLIASWGIPIHAVGFLLKFFQICPVKYVNVTLICVGWYAMVTGQSMVLYSRLHLIVRDGRRIRWILAMIITDFFLFHVPSTVLLFGVNSPHGDPYLQPFAICEKIQITAFSLQEFIISVLYIWEARKMLQSIASIKREEARSVMIHLILVNLLMIVMDITLLGTEYGNQYSIETTYKSTLYSVKLKLEFSILNRLRTLVKSQQHRSRLSGDTPIAPVKPPLVREMRAVSSPMQSLQSGDGIKVSRSFTVTSSNATLGDNSTLRKGSVVDNGLWSGDTIIP